MTEAEIDALVRWVFLRRRRRLRACYRELGLPCR